MGLFWWGERPREPKQPSLVAVFFFSGYIHSIVIDRIEIKRTCELPAYTSHLQF